MATIEFFSPAEGDFIVNLSVPWLKGLVMDASEEFWNSGAGQGSLKWSNGNKSTQLLLTRVTSGLFYLEFIDANGEYFISMGKDVSNEPVTVFVGGDPIRLSRQFLVAKDLNASAVEDFARSGERSTKVIWSRRCDIGWDYSLED